MESLKTALAAFHADRKRVEQQVRESGVPTVECSTCGQLVPRDFSWHYCIPQLYAEVVPHAPPQEPRYRRVPHATTDPLSDGYVPEWAEKL